jgi:hypothetical protein
MAENTGVLPEPVDDLLNLLDVYPWVGCLHVNLKERMTEDAFAEAPSVRVGFLGEYELLYRRNGNVFGNVIGIAAGEAQKPRHETNE